MKNLFGQTEYPKPNKKSANDKAVNAHNTLLQMYGEVDDRCKRCKHFLTKGYSKNYYKCLIATPTGDGYASTDWRANWKACGKFEL